jgi:signal transduction histidine kinase
MTEEQAIGVAHLDSSLLMLRLVNDVLDLSKIDAGKPELEDRDFDLHRLLENLKKMRLQIQAEAWRQGEAGL